VLRPRLFYPQTFNLLSAGPHHNAKVKMCYLSVLLGLKSSRPDSVRVHVAVESVIKTPLTLSASDQCFDNITP
jgi:hypothetical protein